ncbi:uncharacterized protein LOC105218799 [Zeugodacus cucurbitae]|uniref:uncharacterized protein LOC105218799 n=1 Tax=Zeugodacus cucurbitae TaxID=28588 RepID=UPI0023D90BA9|nr:uncharacterized protein LOC105218799 [Zeugodacus cucurbitae]
MKINFYKVPLMLLLISVATTAFVISGDGQPNCTTQEEINTRMFRNYWDPTSYWVCEELNELAVLERCPVEMAYQDNLKECVSWDDWQWEPPILPLTNIEQL